MLMSSLCGMFHKDNKEFMLSWTTAKVNAHFGAGNMSASARMQSSKKVEPPSLFSKGENTFHGLRGLADTLLAYPRNNVAKRSGTILSITKSSLPNFENLAVQHGGESAVCWCAFFVVGEMLMRAQNNDIDLRHKRNFSHVGCVRGANSVRPIQAEFAQFEVGR